MYKDINDIIEAFDSGVQLKYIYFWSHRPTADGSISKTCLSQWFEKSFSDKEGIQYQTAEHFMMAEKARLFKDFEAVKKIIAANHPGAVKKIGRQINNFDESIWQEKRFDIVVQANKLKFSQNNSLQTFLLQTGNRVLVEASPRDTIWGVGLSEQDVKIYNPHNWKGLNLLGFALMTVRNMLGGML